MRNILKIFILSYTLFFFHTVCGQQDTLFNQTDAQGLRQGWWKGYGPNGTLRYKGFFKDGQPLGEMLRYDEDGNLKAKMFYKAGHNKVYTWLYYNDGNIAAEGNYVNSKKDSIWKYYSYYTHTLSSEEIYSQGMRQGISRKFYPEGGILEELYFEKDKKEGSWIQYFDNGVKNLVTQFKNDLRNGPYTLYYPSGKVEITGSFLNNLMEGEWKYFDESGNIKMALQYKNGIPLDPKPIEEIEKQYYEKVDENQGKFPEPDETNFIPMQK